MTVVLLILAIIDIVGNVIVCAIIKRNRDMRYIFILFLFTVEPLHNAHRGNRKRGLCIKMARMGRLDRCKMTPVFIIFFLQFFVKNTLFILAYINLYVDT